MKNLIIVLLLGLNSVCLSQTGYRIKQLANLDQYASYSALWGYTAPNGREYAILGSFEGTSFIDITDSLNIHEVDFLPTPSPGDPGNNWREMKTYSHYAYIVSEADNTGIQIADLQFLPDSIRYVGRVLLPGHTDTHSISQSGPYLYLNGCNTEFTEGIAIVDITNPEVPVLRGKWSTLYVHDSRIINDTIWACNISSDKVTIINALNKDNPVTIRDWINNPEPNAPHNIAFSSNRNFAYVTDETTSPSAGKLKIWNVSDLGNITYINWFNAYPFERSIVHNAETSGNFAFLAYYTAGVKVLNISNPSNPVEIGWFDTYPENNNSVYAGCWGVYIFGSGKVIASDMSRGLFVLRPDLSNPVTRQPSVNFTVASLESRKLDTVRLIDASDGLPSSWQWTVTGPENKFSTEKHPQFTFGTVGNYNVKLRVSNSSGTDSVMRTNVFKILPAQLSAFATLNPSGANVKIIISPNDTSRVLFNWRRSSADTSVDYKVNLRKPAGGEMFFTSSNGGRDSVLLLRRSFLDSVAVAFGLTNDSVVLTYRAKAYNELDSIASTNTVIITLKRESVGIQNVAGELPTEYRLYPAYPNPFNPVTNFEFDLPYSGKAEILLYDISGKQVSMLLNNHVDAGKYKYTFNGSNLNSGVYFIRLSINKFSTVSKIVLIK